MRTGLSLASIRTFGPEKWLMWRYRAEEGNAETAESRARSHNSALSGDEIARAPARAGLSRHALLKSLRRLHSQSSETTSAEDYPGSPPRYAD